MVGEYFDPHYPARVEGQRLGHIEGYHAGQQDGYREGYAAGRAEGWDSAVETCNAKMRKQLEFTSQHVAHIESLKAQIAQQVDLIKKIYACYQDAEAEQERLKKIIADMKRQVPAIGVDHLLRYNKIMVCMNGFQAATEALLDADARAGESIQSIFRIHYQAQVKQAMEAGTISGPVEGDEAFAKAFPKTYKFFVRLSGEYKQSGPKS
jgi:hypothetical protein